MTRPFPSPHLAALAALALVYVSPFSLASVLIERAPEQAEAEAPSTSFDFANEYSVPTTADDAATHRRRLDASSAIADEPTPEVGDSCSAYNTCSDCAASSWGCHWCAHDDACHRVGSIHGCIRSVDCYSNDRCTRKEPEPISRSVFGEVGSLPLAVIFGAGLLAICCATACCVARVGCCDAEACFLVGKRRGDDDDDGRGEYEPPTEQNDLEVIEFETEESVDEEHAAESVYEECVEEGDGGEEEDGDKEDADEEDADEEDEDEDRNDKDAGDAEDEEDAVDADDEEEDAEDEPLLDGRPSADGAEDPLIPSQWTPAREGGTRLRWPSRGFRDARRPQTGCKICYAVAVAAVLIVMSASVYYFPQAPDYNVCNDRVAWKSIIDGIASGKMQASLQLLMSVENPNRLSVRVETGSGTFKHDGVEVGTFELPAATIVETSITDVLVDVTFTPDKEQALALATEYYKGTLELAVDAKGSVVIPGLAWYTFSGGVEDYVVRVNDPKLQDQHLCVCPQ